jgi:hypothetical protein
MWVRGVKVYRVGFFIKIAKTESHLPFVSAMFIWTNGLWMLVVSIGMKDRVFLGP